MGADRLGSVAGDRVAAVTRRPVSLAYAREVRRARLVRGLWYGAQAALVAALGWLLVGGG